MSDLPAGYTVRPAGGAATLPPGYAIKGGAAPAQSSEKPSETGIGEALWAGLLHGAGNIVHGAARIGARMGEASDTGFGPELAPGTAESVDNMTIARQKAFEQEPTTKQHPIATKIGEVGGEAVGATAMTAPLALVPGAGGALWARLLAGGIQGAAGGALEGAAEAPQGEIGPSAARGAAVGAAVGAPLGAVGAPEIGAVLRDMRGSGPGVRLMR